MYEPTHQFEFQPETFEFTGEYEYETGYAGEPEMPFSEAEAMELALELLEVGSEAELEQFLGKVFKKAWRGIKTVGSKLVRPLGSVLKTVAKTALPFVATAAGTFFGGPAGGALAGKLGSMVSQALEAEVQGETTQNRDLQKSIQFVHMAGQAARAAALAPAGTNPLSAATDVLANAAKRKLAAARAGVAPAGPSRSCACGKPSGLCQCGKSGRWVRRGKSIVIINC